MCDLGSWPKGLLRGYARSCTLRRCSSPGLHSINTVTLVAAGGGRRTATQDDCVWSELVLSSGWGMSLHMMENGPTRRRGFVWAASDIGIGSTRGYGEDEVAPWGGHPGLA